MQYYLKLVGLALLVGGAIGTLASIFLDAVPWEREYFHWVAAYFCISSAYFVVFLGTVNEILLQRGTWANNRLRCFGVPLIGASLGVFVSAGNAIMGASGLPQLRTDQMERLFSAAAPGYLSKGQDLLVRGEVLAIVKAFVDSCVQDAAFFAVFMMITTWIYDTFRSWADKVVKPTDETASQCR